jgi:hypothetical protein
MTQLRSVALGDWHAIVVSSWQGGARSQRPGRSHQGGGHYAAPIAAPFIGPNDFLGEQKD